MVPTGSRLWLLALLIVASGLVVDLAIQNRSLRAGNLGLSRRLSLVHAGMYEPTFQTTTFDGKPAVIGASASGSRQVLFVFTTTCPYCKRTVGAWQRIADSLGVLRDVKAEVFGISLDSGTPARRYVGEHHLTFPVVEFPERKLPVLYRTRSVPSTVVLDSVGRVIFARVGYLADSLLVDSVVSAVRWRPAPPMSVGLRSPVR
jgi:peroxiredoxin